MSMDKNYLREVANQIRGHFSDDELPTRGLDDLFDLYAVLALLKGETVTNADVHDAWCAWATKYDASNKSLVPYDELPNDVKSEDSKFRLAIQKTAQKISH